ncbi:MAG: hypothetical protein M3Q29_04600 [Chloroflexota bacterium]|nr:hypothetical protein [Chloroflexota bacterium]
MSMYVWITARRIKQGMMDQFLKAWQDPVVTLPISPASPEGPTVYALHPTDDPNEMWGVGFFDSLETVKRVQESPEVRRRSEMLAPYVEETLWERTFEARHWGEADRPLVYAVYLQTAPQQMYRLMAIRRDAAQAIKQADALVARARENGHATPEWTMRAFAYSDEAPETLSAEEGHPHPSLR